MNLDQELKTMLRERAEDVAAASVVPERTLRRVRVRKALWTGGALAAVAAVGVMSAVILRSTVWTDASPVPPAQERNQEIEQMRDGNILHADSNWWQGNAAPPPPGGRHTYIWDAYDEDTGSFLYSAQSPNGRVWVVGVDGLVAEIDCPASSACGHYEMDTFGPGPDEITVPSADSCAAPGRGLGLCAPRSVHVIGFDGTLHDRLDISAILSQGRDLNLSDLAWSPDGNRLAISTDCYGTSALCEGMVWIFDRDGGEPQLVYTEQQQPVIRDLAWSPDGRTLALLVASGSFVSDSTQQARPRLVALRMPPNQPVRAETLKVYDDSGMELVLADDYHVAFPFAWSPDGTRIAVTSAGGIAEISSGDGGVLARHPGEGVGGPLAWLPEH